MRVERFDIGDDPAGAARRIRALVPGAESVAAPVAEIIAAVAAGGDERLREYVRRFDAGGQEPPPIRVEPGELQDALERLDPEVRAGLKRAAANVRAVAEAGVREDRAVELPEGHRVVLREVPVRRAAVYVPGGRAPYPSTVVMGVVTARAAGVDEVVVCAPGGHEAILAACALTGADEVFRMGGAHAVAALAHGTDSIRRVDVIVGPGNLWVQEAKSQVAHLVGIDGFAGPSDVLVLSDGTAEQALVALDLRAQAEHGEGTLVVAVAAEPLDRVADDLEKAPDTGAVAALGTGTTEQALAFAEAFAPEHLELVGPVCEALAPRVRSAGCVFVGAAGATAFGDYVAGSNHCLPTEGTARFSSALGPGHFRRRMSEVHIGGAAPELAPAGAAIARAEGFAVHAESMEARVGDNRTR